LSRGWGVVFVERKKMNEREKKEQGKSATKN
jgi:hypothetical protein